MGYGERSPLRGSVEHVPYVFMSDPNRAYKKRVRQLQCYLCTAILGVFMLALLFTVAFAADDEEIDVMSGPLALKTPAKSVGPPEDTHNSGPSTEENGGVSSLKKNGAASTHSPCMENEELTFDCPVSEFRTADGFCNNLNHPLTWGLSDRPFKRLLSPDYCDGSSSPRCSTLKSSLPSSFNVSSKLHNFLNGKIGVQNMVGILWSNFVYQDLVGVVPSDEKDGFCCDESHERSSSCFPIEISKDDSNFSYLNASCLPYFRSKSVSCADGKRMTINTATSFLDGSAIYGSSESIQKKLRKFENGQLVLFITPENKYLPIAINEEKECNISKNGVFKPYTNQGFSCLGQQMNISSINLMFAKHHNNIALQLNVINPHWNDEELFQNAKKIVSAQIQHITYKDYLDNLIGTERLKSLGDIQTNGYYEEYDDKIDSSVSEGFADTFKLLSTRLSGNSNPKEPNDASKPHELYTLAQLIQMERDHGVPGYIKWYEHCSLGKLTSFSGMAQALGSDVAFLQNIYQNVEDVDLVAGIVTEMPQVGGQLGPVGSCILTEQLKRTKSGDRFWYETANTPQSFNEEQLSEIHKSTLSRIVCDYSKNVKMVQYNILKDSDESPTLSCDSIPALNLSLWEEKKNGLEVTQATKTPQPKDKVIENFMETGNAYMQRFILGKSSATKSNVTKKATNFLINVMNATVKVGDEVVYDKSSVRPPFTFPLDSIADLSAFTPAATVSFSANYEDDILQGTLSIPMKNSFEKDFVRMKKSVTMNFTAGVTIKWSGTFDLDPKRIYNCKLMFQSYAKLSLTSKPASPLQLKAGESGEQCNILLVGSFYSRPFYCSLTPWLCQEGMIFYWSGDTKLIFTKPATNENSIKSESFVGLSKTSHILKKTGNDVVEKTFASVTVIKGKITGQYNVGESFEVMNGSPPINIPLDNFINPNSFDISMTATWKAKPLDESTLEGTFSVPYYPALGDDSGRKKFAANFTVDIIYKYGGAIEIIDPTKTYTCKTMFHSNKKSSFKTKLSLSNDLEQSYNHPVLSKTPFGESCSITISGSFVEKSAYCFFAPWWCTDEKLFLWSGDIELALKYKYNKTDSEEDSLKKLELKKGETKPKVKSDVIPYQAADYYNPHRYGGKVSSGWIQIKTGGLFSSTKTIWSGEIPFAVKLPVFWTPTNDDGAETSDVYGHAILWSASIFHSTIQGSFSFPQFIGNGPQSSIKWISGKFSFEVEPNPYVSLYDLIVPSMQYKSNLYFHNSPDITPFSNTKVGDPTQEDIGTGIRAPIILLGKYTADKNFIWNGTFVIAFTRTAKDLYYG